MKKIFALLTVFGLTISSANAGILSPFASTYATIELGKSVLSNQSINSKFENGNDFFENLRQFEDIALGGHIRFGLLGVNVNWSQTSLKNNRLKGYDSLESQAKYKSDQINATALFFLPIIPTRAELFVEAGVVDIGSKLHYTPTGGTKVQRKGHETIGLYGIGAQVSPFGGDFIRLSAQRYIGKIGLLDTEYTTIRLGYLKSF
jgi:hypothetical protein